jgi:hypothetical protein
MTLFKAYDLKVEVNGETVLSVVDGLGTFKATALKWLKDCGIDTPKPGMWYSQQSWLNCFKLISEKLGPASLKKIGEAIPRNAQWPPQVNSIETALSSIDIAYRMNHRKGNIGNYKFTLTSPDSGIMVCDNPYPDHFDLGIIESAANKFKKAGQVVFVKIDDSKPTRTKGAESTTFNVTW